MALSMLYGETKVGIAIDLSPYLVSIDKEMSDRIALIFMLKSDKTAADGAAEYSITEGANLVVSGDTVTAYVSTFGSLAVDTTYYVGIGIQFTGDTLYRELQLKPNSSTIKFSQDVIRS